MRSIFFAAVSFLAVATFVTRGHAMLTRGTAHQCVGVSFPGQSQIRLTNTCTTRIIAIWESDAGRSASHLDPGQSELGYYRGRVGWTASR